MTKSLYNICVKGYLDEVQAARGKDGLILRGATVNEFAHLSEWMRGFVTVDSCVSKKFNILGDFTMKRNNKKGFTIVELVIVIAVIAILSAAMIPTFGGITKKAQASARAQEARNAYTNYLIDSNADDSDLVIVVDNVGYYLVVGGEFNATEYTADNYEAELDEGATTSTYTWIDSINNPGSSVVVKVVAAE